MSWRSATHPVGLLSSDLCPDEIEQKIIRAYVKLVFSARDATGSRTTLVARFGSLDVRLTEFPQESLSDGRPLFWLEIYSHATRSTVDSCGCSEFDESELATAVNLVLKAKQRHEVYH